MHGFRIYKWEFVVIIITNLETVGKFQVYLKADIQKISSP